MFVVFSVYSNFNNTIINTAIYSYASVTLLVNSHDAGHAMPYQICFCATTV